MTPQQQINQIVTHYLIENIGEMAMQGLVQYDAELKLWRVPILCRTNRGILLAGEVQLTNQLEIQYATPLDEMLDTLQAQLTQLDRVPLSHLPAPFFIAPN